MLTVRAQTANEEFEYLWNILKNISFYQEHNYSLSLPDNKLINWNISVGDVDKNYYENIFIDRIYSSSFFEKGIENVQKKIPVVENILDDMKLFNRKWGFKLFTNYLILLTRYGPGGSYNQDSGTILMLTKEDGSFKRGNLLDTIVHEIVHIGVEEIIVKKYSLSHKEKECLVDWIVLHCFSKYLPDYKVQKFKGENIFDMLRNEALENLPEVIKDLRSNISSF